MKYHDSIKTKRGILCNLRPNKQAQGWTKAKADNFHQTKKEHLCFVVYGTGDVLTRKVQYTENKVVSHPDDPSYTKKVKRLGKYGKFLLKQLRRSRS